jgi:hypothetical protein
MLLKIAQASVAMRRGFLSPRTFSLPSFRDMKRDPNTYALFSLPIPIALAVGYVQIYMVKKHLDEKISVSGIYSFCFSEVFCWNTHYWDTDCSTDKFTIEIEIAVPAWEIYLGNRSKKFTIRTIPVTRGVELHIAPMEGPIM